MPRTTRRWTAALTALLVAAAEPGPSRAQTPPPSLSSPPPSPPPSPPSPSPSPLPSARDVRDVVARGNVLAIGAAYVAFTTGATLRLRPGTPVPPNVGLASAVRVRIDARSGEVVAIERGASPEEPGEIDVANLPRAFLAVSPGSAPSPANAASLASTAKAAAAVVTLVVDVPASTPPGDDVFVSTQRSNYSPSEVRMQRVSARRFTVSISVPAGTKLQYQYTRGSYATVERDRTGGIVEPRDVTTLGSGSANDTVARWADLT